MKRRDALAGGAALAACLASGVRRVAAAGVVHARRTRRYTWAPNLWTMTHALPLGENPVTLAYACGVPDDFSAIRVGFLCAADAPWQISKVVAMASASWNDYVTPTGGAAPVTLTFGGQAAGSILPSPVQQTRGSVIPGVTWSDWVPLRSQPADPETGMRVLMLRALVPGGQTITCCNGTWGGYAGAHGGSTAINHGYDIFTGGLKGIDRVTNPLAQRNESTPLYIGNNPCNGTIFAIIQAKTAHEGYALCQVGESKFFGTSTTSQMWNWQLRSVGLLGSEYAGRVPIGYCCTAVGGYDSAHAFGLAREILPEVDPALVDIPSYNGNERLFGLPYTDLHSEQVQMAMTRDFMQFVRGLGGIPILASPMPNCGADAPPSPRIANSEPGYRAAFTAWKTFAAKHDGPVFDLYASLGANEADEDCRYREAYMTKDGNHPDDAGHALLVEPYLALIKPMLGL